MSKYVSILAALAFILPLPVLCQDDVDAVCPKYVERRGPGTKVVHNGVCYYFFKMPDTQREAALDCEANFGSIFMPKTEELSDFLLDQVTTFGWTETWLGLKDDIFEGQFIWSDESYLDVDDYTNFADGNGIYRQGLTSSIFYRDNDCVYLNAGDKKWYDTSCKSRAEKYYACQY